MGKKMSKLLKHVVENSFRSMVLRRQHDIDYIKVDYCSSQEKHPIFSLLIPKEECRDWIEMGKNYAFNRRDKNEE